MKTYNRSIAALRASVKSIDLRTTSSGVTVRIVKLGGQASLSDATLTDHAGATCNGPTIKCPPS